MKYFLSFTLLCLLAVASCKKADQQYKEEKSHAWSEKKSHNVKKYTEDKAQHHDKHQKMHSHENTMNHEAYPSKTQKHKEHLGYHEIPKHEAELQRDIKATKKEIDDRLANEEQDLHLQDLTHPDSPDNVGHKNHKSPHQYQRGHHKESHHFAHTKASHNLEKEEKLFVEPELKQESKQPHPVLEDSFEAVNEEAVKEQPQESQLKKKHSSKNKKSNKKASEKVKEKSKKKDQENTKNKDGKKNKKHQHKEKKEKKQW